MTPEFENLAEHTFRVTWIALLIGKHEGADLGKVAQMAMVHGISESRVGELDYVSREYATRNEEDAMKEMFKDTKLSEEFIALWEEYEKRESLEAKVVKDADNIDVDMELQEQAARGNSIKKVFASTREQVEKTKLYTDTAKKLMRSIKTADPHDWHRNAKNRHTSGDWKN